MARTRKGRAVATTDSEVARAVTGSAPGGTLSPTASGGTSVPGGRGATPGAAPGAGGKVRRKDRDSTVWARVVPALVALVVMLIFILQNFQDVKVSFITLHGSFPLALALLFAAILGALVVVSLELVRVVQRRKGPGNPRH